MAKIRVYELARELNVESKALLSKLKSLNIEVASHQSTLTDQQVALVKKGEQAGGEGKPKVVVRRRKSASSDSGDDRLSARSSDDDAEDNEENNETDVEDNSAKDKMDIALGQEQVDDQKDEDVTVGDASVLSENVHVAEEVLDAEAKQPVVESKPEVVSTPRDNVVVGKTAVVVERPPFRKSEAPTPVVKPKFQGGATIVRKASTEEIVKQTEERVKVKPSNKRNFEQVTTPVYEEYEGGGEESGKSQLSGFGKPKSKTKEKTVTAEEERARQRALAAKGKKRIKSTRELLEGINEDEAPAFVSKRKTVYTPSSANKKRDVKRRKDLKSTEITTPRASYRVVKMQETITVGELAMQMSTKAGEVIKKLMDQGVMATINQVLDVDTTTLIAGEFGFEVKSVVITIDDILKKEEKEYSKSTRPPIVTIMGHVDHGKTSILDALRQSGVASTEAGGITQHIGAYTVQKDGKNITFLDTPGHEAFSAMRSRGAGVTDIVILVVAADDGVMPQTVEAISHAKNAGVPIIVAVNKIDKPNQNLDRVYAELAEHGVQSEEWGGDNQFVKTSALEKIGLEDLLDSIHLQAEVLELEASPDAPGEGAVVEAHVEKGFGAVATILVTNGHIQKGDYVVAGQSFGRVRAMIDDKGKNQYKAGPGTPVRVIGLPDVPMAGDAVNVVANEKIAKEIAAIRAAEEVARRSAKSSARTLEDLLNRVNSSDIPEVPVIIKADTQGSVEAICETIAKLNTDGVKNRVIHRAVGGINESDLSLAETSGAVVLGFNVRAGHGLEDKAEKAGVIINYFSIIYELVDTVKNLMSGKLPPIQTEVIQGHAEVRDSISVPRIGTIAGSAVTDGKITRNSMLRLIREDIVIYNGKIGSLRRFKDDVKEVSNGYECGIGIDGYNDIKIGDVIEAYIIEETAATL